MINFPCNYDELEIVGFDGAVKIECGRFLPLVRHKETDHFFKLSLHDSVGTSRAVFSRDEIELFSAQGRLTFLPEPVPAFKGAMVIYFTRAFLDATESLLPESFIWQRLSYDVWATCVVQQKAEQLLNNFAQALMDKATDLLGDFILGRNLSSRDAAKRLTDMAVCAAIEKELRSRIYLRYGLALILSNTPERLDNVYQLIISREFPTWTWESFKIRLHRFKDIVTARVFPLAREGETQQDYSQMLLTVVEQISYIQTTTNFQERLDECQRIARKFRELYPTEYDDIQRVGKLLCTSDGIRLDDENLYVLAGEPLFYNHYYDKPFEIKQGKSRPLLTFFDFWKTVEGFKQEGFKMSEVARYIFEECAPIAAYSSTANSGSSEGGTHGI